MLYGFGVSKLSGTSIDCARKNQRRSYTSKVSPSKQRQSTSMKCSCSYAILFSRYGKKDNDLVRIREINPVHVTECCPGDVLTVTHVKKKNGSYALNRRELLLQIANLTVGGYVPSNNAIRLMARTSFPPSVSLSSTDCSNIIIRAKMLKANLIKSDSFTLEEIKFEGVEGMSLTDESIKCAEEVLYATLRSSDQGWLLLNYFKQLKSTDPSFTYRVSRDESSVPTGFIWMTGTMRRSFELYGSCLFLDMMKRSMSNLHWPYVGPVVLDGQKKICVVAEGFVCGEIHEAYSFVLKSIFEMAPAKKKEDVGVVFSDSFLNDTVLRSVGMSARHVLDAYHLRTVDWPKAYGSHYSRVQRFLDKMLFANDEDEFNEGYNLASQELSGKHLEYLNKYKQCPEKFSRFKIRSYPGNLGRHGSSHAEQNHSSITQRINKCLLTEPHDTVLAFMLRQQTLINESNQSLFSYRLKSEGEASLMDSDDPRKIPKTNLSSWGYQLWEESFRMSKTLGIKGINLTEKERCRCDRRISYFIQCHHELAIRNFDLRDWDERWYIIRRLGTSDKIANVATDHLTIENEDNDEERFMVYNGLSPNFVFDVDDTERDDKDGDDKDDDDRKISASDDKDMNRDTGKLMRSWNKEKYSTKQGYGLLKEAALRVISFAAKSSNTCYILLSLFKEIETVLTTGTSTISTVDAKTVGDWIRTVLALRPKRKFASISNGDEVTPLATNMSFGRPQEKRLKSIHELEMKKIKSPKSCSLCLQKGHNTQSCSLVKTYGSYLTTKGDVGDLMVTLSNHTNKDNAQRRSRRSHVPNSEVPSGTLHLVIEELLFEESFRSSVPLGVLCTCLKSGGKPLDDWSKKIFETATVIKWIHSHGKCFSKLMNSK